jgi:hypothetical protein
LPPYLADIHAGATKPEGAAPARDAQTFHAIQRIDQLLRHALAEVTLITFRTHVGERQDGDRRTLRRGRLSQSRDEAVTVAMSRFDVARLSRIIPESLA